MCFVQWVDAYLMHFSLNVKMQPRKFVPLSSSAAAADQVHVKGEIEEREEHRRVEKRCRMILMMQQWRGSLFRH